MRGGRVNKTGGGLLALRGGVLRATPLQAAPETDARDHHEHNQPGSEAAILILCNPGTE